MYQYLLFDLDGTLTDPQDGITRCVQFALAHFGIQVPAESLTEFIGPPLCEHFMEYAHFDRPTAEEAVVWYRKRFAETGIFENAVFDRIPEMLTRLKKAGKTLCVASSKPEVYVRQILEHFSLTDFFSVITGGELDGRRTAKAEVIEETLRRLHYTGDRRDVLMIGDRIHDIKGAETCQIDALGVTFGYAPAGELETSSAAGLAASPDEIASWILSRN